MAQFEIFQNPGQRKDEIPFLVEVQNNHISNATGTTIVIPLRTDATQSVSIIAPLISVRSRGRFVLSTVELFAIESGRLKKPIGTLSAEDQAKIQPALDKVFGRY